MTNPMNPKDALGELVKEWKENMAKLIEYNDLPLDYACDHADQLEKVREGKVLVDAQLFKMLLNMLSQNGYAAEKRANELRREYLPKEPK